MHTTRRALADRQRGARPHVPKRPRAGRPVRLPLAARIHVRHPCRALPRSGRLPARRRRAGQLRDLAARPAPQAGRRTRAALQRRAEIPPGRARRRRRHRRRHARPAAVRGRRHAPARRVAVRHEPAGEIAFNDTGSGKPIAFSRWAAGDRPRPSGRSLVWSRGAAPDAGYASFRRYMDTVFTWAGTHSLERQLAAVPLATSRRRSLHQGGLSRPRRAGRRRRQVRRRRDALPAAAELHAGTADARPEEPAGCRTPRPGTGSTSATAC